MVPNFDASLIIKRIDANASKHIVDLALDIVNDLRSNPPTGTPVDTGWASNNWIPSISIPITKTKGERPAKGTKMAVDSSSGIAALLMYTVGRGKIYIVNNVPYITYLERGHSKQSPAGWVKRAVQRALANARKRLK